MPTVHVRSKTCEALQCLCVVSCSPQGSVLFFWEAVFCGKKELRLEGAGLSQGSIPWSFLTKQCAVETPSHAFAMSFR